MRYAEGYSLLGEVGEGSSGSTDMTGSFYSTGFLGKRRMVYGGRLDTGAARVYFNFVEPIDRGLDQSRTGTDTESIRLPRDPPCGN